MSASVSVMSATVTQLRGLIAQWDALVDSPDTGFEVQLLALAELRELIDKLRQLASVQERVLIRAMPTDRFEGTGIYAQRVSGGRRYSNWDHGKIGRRLLGSISPGGVVAEPDDVVEAMLRAARPTWRTTVLRELGIRLDDVADITTLPPKLFLNASDAAFGNAATMRSSLAAE